MQNRSKVFFPGFWKKIPDFHLLRYSQAINLYSYCTDMLCTRDALTVPTMLQISAAWVQLIWGVKELIALQFGLVLSFPKVIISNCLKCWLWWQVCQQSFSMEGTVSLITHILPNSSLYPLSIKSPAAGFHSSLPSLTVSCIFACILFRRYFGEFSRIQFGWNLFPDS